MTGYVSTRYYRAPEIMLTWQKYDVAGMLLFIYLCGWRYCENVGSTWRGGTGIRPRSVEMLGRNAAEGQASLDIDNVILIIQLTSGRLAAFSPRCSKASPSFRAKTT